MYEHVVPVPLQQQQQQNSNDSINKEYNYYSVHGYMVTVCDYKRIFNPAHISQARPT